MDRSGSQGKGDYDQKCMPQNSQIAQKNTTYATTSTSEIT